MKTQTTCLQVDEQGRLLLPEELSRRLGLVAGAQVMLKDTADGLLIERSTASLAKIYVEPTNQCNLDCTTCMRNVWQEPSGEMGAATFARILEGVRQANPKPVVFFGGFGEPLSHPALLDMVAEARDAGAAVEMITNGTLLDEPTARRLIALKLNRLWVSIDGATPQSYADVRLGDALPLVIENLTRLRILRYQHGADLPRLGVAFVAMQRNLKDLPEVVRLGKNLGADRFSVSNVLPHTAELRQEILFGRSMFEGDVQPSQWSPIVSLPRIDASQEVIELMADILRTRVTLQIGGQNLELGANSCPFIARGSISIRWDGAVSPCLPLLHSHTAYLGETMRSSQAYTLGNINDRGLSEIWNDPAYVELRRRVQAFDFSPCTFCLGCEKAESNQEDCIGSIHPACGGCLWAQGFIQCP